MSGKAHLSVFAWKFLSYALILELKPSWVQNSRLIYTLAQNTEDIIQ